MNNAHPRPHRFLLALLLPLLLALTPNALAQEQTGEWEYLVVSYGTTYFDNPLPDSDADGATYSKVQLFSDIGVTIPNEAIALQRNVDVLGMFGWEMVTVVGSIGGDQQIVFKRPYDAERSAEEAERIKAEREELIAAYNATNEATEDDEPTEETPQLVDVDAVERAQATEARNERDANTVRGIIEATAASGFPLPALDVNGEAYAPDSKANVRVRVTQDVTETALIAPGQYRKSLVKDAVDEFFAALAQADLPESDDGLCWRDLPEGKAMVTVVAVINHNDVASEVGTYRQEHCFNP